MKVGDYRDHEQPPRIVTQREKKAQLDKNKCARCDAFGLFYNKKKNIFLCEEHKHINIWRVV